MALSPTQLATLHTELTTDPLSLGYAALLAGSTPDTVGVSEILNAVGTTSAYNVPNSQVTIAAITGAIVQADYLALTSQQQGLIGLSATGGSVDATNSSAWSNFLAVFAGASSESLTALAAAGLRLGTRGEVIFGPGTSIDPNDVVAAIKL